MLWEQPSLGEEMFPWYARMPLGFDFTILMFALKIFQIYLTNFVKSFEGGFYRLYYFLDALQVRHFDDLNAVSSSIY